MSDDEPMSNDEFLRYVLAHSQTGRAGFTVDQYERLMELAVGTPKGRSPHTWSPTAIITIRYHVAEELVQMARSRVQGPES